MAPARTQCGQLWFVPTLAAAAGMPAMVRLLSGFRRELRALHHSGRADNLKMGLNRAVWCSFSRYGTSDLQWCIHIKIDALHGTVVPLLTVL